MTALDDSAEIQKLIANPLDRLLTGADYFAGIIGAAPSQYSKSPPLWNAAFRSLGMNAVYVPFDVEDAKVGELLAVLKDYDNFLGVNVTVPHKVRVIEFLDQLDSMAARIQAVNTVVRTPAGEFIGYNTDGEGFIESLLAPSAVVCESFTPSLKDLDVLLLGAGGSARAVAFHLSDHLENGKLIIANRSLEHASSLSDEICAGGGRAIAIEETEIPRWAPKVGLIVNSTTKGQGGRRRTADGKKTSLEPYSALAPAHPPSVEVDDADFETRWRAAARSDITANQRNSESLVQSIPRTTRFYDLIYHPEESVFLRQGRASGHPTMNGRNMIVCQAVIALCQHVCRDQLLALGKDPQKSFHQIRDVMNHAW